MFAALRSRKRVQSYNLFHSPPNIFQYFYALKHIFSCDWRGTHYYIETGALLCSGGRRAVITSRLRRSPSLRSATSGASCLRFTIIVAPSGRNYIAIVLAIIADLGPGDLSGGAMRARTRKIRVPTTPLPEPPEDTRTRRRGAHGYVL